jgi:hypothetical protein
VACNWFCSKQFKILSYIILMYYLRSFFIQFQCFCFNCTFNINIPVTLFSTFVILFKKYLLISRSWVSLNCSPSTSEFNQFILVITDTDLFRCNSVFFLIHSTHCISTFSLFLLLPSSCLILNLRCMTF